MRCAGPPSGAAAATMTRMLTDVLIAASTAVAGGIVAFPALRRVCPHARLSASAAGLLIGGGFLLAFCVGLPGGHPLR